ncbi:DinB family protein [Flavilitoribacter nigricans]|uniref:Uncharacterized protein n=1 Tax=Flavilitoribacter nigricans (strain ATCC 23147 / DSM 23189 / NBRC 102662 / NCIMB 1420 / SS-2) TaxID=1122177 RepID=A0A2D0NBX3_FLAN2|nr:DinB family protein [Flavilitoribacter nigricans]PHN06004.1 hypothetical protein CRP01_13625 [Flavilitoribacter nigricans DSM 23189 = NBRC 102662]
MALTPIQQALKSQYHSALFTLEQTIRTCPPDLWTDPKYPNPYWQVAYHALHYAHLYLEQHLEDFQDWEKHREEHQWFSSEKMLTPYTPEELLEYCRFCREKVDRAMENLDLDHPESGFSWYQMPKLEHQIVNIRHIQHHAAQLTDRLRSGHGLGTPWIQGADKIPV